MPRVTLTHRFPVEFEACSFIGTADDEIDGQPGFVSRNGYRKPSLLPNFVDIADRRSGIIFNFD